MPDDVYTRLAQMLDDLPGGFPRSESGVELRILRRLFTPEEAALALHLTLIAEEAPVIARRAGVRVAEAERLLGELERKRLVLAFPDGKGRARYMAQQFVVGFWEGQVDRLDRELVELFEEYLPVYARSGLWGRSPQLRTVPVRESIPVENAILPYEQIDAILGSHKVFAVANCICRQEQRVLGSDCGKPLETCLAFGSAADYIVRAGRGRHVTREEAVALLALAEQAGLVLQVGNDRAPGNVCMCCGCCCGVLRSLKLHPQPASQGSSPFYAALDESLCAGCGVCLTRCQMDALSLNEVTGTASLDLNRCIGCGLCVTTCPSGALTLVRKPPAAQPDVPKDVVRMMIRMGQSRGKLGYGALARLVTRSAVDRLKVKLGL